MEPKRVTLVVGREGRSHTDFWTPMLEKLDRAQQFSNVVTRVPLADWVSRPVSRTLRLPWQDLRLPWEVIEQSTDILIINWDAVNGDPDFGGDVALRWFEHQQIAVRKWLNAGGLLILDGQAVGGVPHDRFYAAVLGEGEVRLSGREDPRDPDRERARMSGNCRVTRVAQQARRFNGLEHVNPRQDRTFDELYPPQAVGKLVPRYLTEIDMKELLYRGWFRRRNPSTSMRWTPYVRRDERWPRNFPTLLAAKCGDLKGKEEGLVFASTMMLAATGQEPLIRAMLGAHGSVADLPEESSARRAAVRYGPKVVAGLLTGVLVYFFASAETLGGAVAAVVVGIAVTAVLDALPWISRSTHRLVRAFTGA